MASYAATTSVHKTLTTTTADAVTLGSATTPPLSGVTVVNQHATVYIYFTVGFGGAPTTAVSLADNTYVVPPAGARTRVDFPANTASTVVVSIVGNANPYDCVGERLNAIQA